MNDGSTDNTVQIIERFIASSPLNIKLINQENQGAPSARNNGIRNASGEYIQFLDADDILTQNKFDQQIRIVEANNSPDIIIGSYQRETMEGEIVLKKIYNPSNVKSVWASLMKTDLGITSSNLFNSNLFSNGIKWNESFQSSQEYELMFQILKNNGQLIFDSEINTIVRIRESGSISQQNIKQKWERYVELRVSIINYLKLNSQDEVNDELYQLLFTCIRMLYPHNSEMALKHFNEHIPKNFRPIASTSIGGNYLRLFNIFGFKKTEKIRSIFSKEKAS